MKRRTFTVPAQNTERQAPSHEEIYLAPDDPDLIQPAIEFSLPDGTKAWVYGTLAPGTTTLTVEQYGIFKKKYRIAALPRP